VASPDVAHSYYYTLILPKGPGDDDDNVYRAVAKSITLSRQEVLADKHFSFSRMPRGCFSIPESTLLKSVRANEGFLRYRLAVYRP